MTDKCTWHGKIICVAVVVDINISAAKDASDNTKYVSSASRIITIVFVIRNKSSFISPYYLQFHSLLIIPNDLNMFIKLMLRIKL